MMEKVDGIFLPRMDESVESDLSKKEETGLSPREEVNMPIMKNLVKQLIEQLLMPTL